ncbi:cation:proton antiporter [Oceaniglobus trochenteri]|uniref:cation:proton antiporter n=1 Tax=Oceaniglobus trochenteri TaxID=2763260 RepID=UPI001CFFDEA2|nr:sodium:proton antiporter [Oceaniglobus trochenteri]
MHHMGPNVEIILLGILACVIVYSLLTKAISRTILTLPIIFMVIGLLASAPMTALAPPAVMHDFSRLLAEITLILILFADASHVRFARLKGNIQYPLRMLVIGMPLTILLGTLVVYMLSPTGGVAMALLTAAVLTPTDAALGQTVVSSPDVPPRLSQTINIESGLNDGLALPFVLLGAILASAGMEQARTEGLAIAALLQLVLGPAVGVLVGWAVARALDMAFDRDWVAESAQGVVFLATAFAAYLLAELIGGNGFIAAFVGGAVFGNAFRHDIHFITEFMESQGQLLTMSAFLIFGAVLLPAGLNHMTPTAVIIAVLFLTVVRMGPIVLSLAGSRLNLREKLFLGWFGPRGIASILFTLIMIDEYEFPREDELLACVSMTVFLSILLHGVSATPLARRIGRA